MAKLSANTLNLDRLREAAGEEIYEQGTAYYRWGRVEIDEVAGHFAICFVHDNQTYPVRISVNENYLYLHCDCDFAEDGNICRHDVAAAVGLHEYLKKLEQPKWREHLNNLDRLYGNLGRRGRPVMRLLFFSLQRVNNVYSRAGESDAWKIQPYVLPLKAFPLDQRADVEHLDRESLASLLQNNPDLAGQARQLHQKLSPEACINCSQETVGLANLLLDRTRTVLNYYHYEPFPLTDFLSVLAKTDCPLFTGDAYHPFQTSIQPVMEPGDMRIMISRAEDGLHLRAKIVTPGDTFELDRGALQVISTEPIWLLSGRKLLRLQDERLSSLVLQWLRTPEVQIPVEEESEFLENRYLRLAEQLPLEGDLVSWETIQATPVGRIYLTESKGKLQAELRFGYGDYEVPYATTPPTESIAHRAESWVLVRIKRNARREEALYRALSSNTYRLKRAPKPAPDGTFVLRARAHPIDFLMYSVPRLAEDGYEIYGEEQLKSVRVNRKKPSISFNVSSGIDWFDVQAAVKFGNLEVPLKEMRRALRKNQRYVKLADGSIGEIPPEWLEKYKHLFALGETKDEVLRLSQHHLGLVDQLLAEADRVRTDAEFDRRRKRLREFSGIVPQPLPEGFRGDLRPYQKAGYDWLHFLKEFHFGGCLADDMGLGKTVQVLVFLQSLKENISSSSNGHAREAKTSLVVVPRSLLVNWQREAARFTPNLRILEYFDADRPKDPQVFDEYDVLITTYGIMRRDVKLLREYTFEYVILDESQAIKNPAAQTSKSARVLKSRHRLALTGTPVENSTIELWSQFAFLNPGLLGSLDYFRNEFVNPIEKKGNEAAAEFLRKMVYPFILRRTKDQVAPELPPRSERILYSDMEPAQRKLYNRTRDTYRSMLLGMLENEGLHNTRMKILEGLLRLRQISNHPSLVDEKFRGSSGKFELLLETLQTLQAEGHKALVFSQFVQMLKLVRRELDKRKVPYLYLDGQTRNRQERVDSFQSDPKIPFFLISLKAGGQGLNLTAADYVIHIDPWWNPAVEMQATDRSHRIGQDKPVFVYKLIARNSVEEKILQLQTQKKELVDQLVTTESGFFKNLSEQDVQVLFE